jgi:hypothetical protein
MTKQFIVKERDIILNRWDEMQEALDFSVGYIKDKYPSIRIFDETDRKMGYLSMEWKFHGVKK